MQNEEELALRIDVATILMTAILSALDNVTRRRVRVELMKVLEAPSSSKPHGQGFDDRIRAILNEMSTL